MPACAPLDSELDEDDVTGRPLSTCFDTVGLGVTDAASCADGDGEKLAGLGVGDAVTEIVGVLDGDSDLEPVRDAVRVRVTVAAKPTSIEIRSTTHSTSSQRVQRGTMGIRRRSDGFRTVNVKPSSVRTTRSPRRVITLYYLISMILRFELATSQFTYSSCTDAGVNDILFSFGRAAGTEVSRLGLTSLRQLP